MPDRYGTRRTMLGALLLAFAMIPAVAEIGSAQTNAVKLVKGVISDAKTGSPVNGGTVLAFIGSATEPAARGRINPKTGAYQLILNPDTEYRIRVASPRFRATDFSYRTSANAEYEEVEKNFSLEAIPAGSTLFSGKFFEGTTDHLRTSGDLTKTLEFLKQNQAVTVEIAIAPEGKAARPKKKEKGNESTLLDQEDPLVAARRKAILDLFSREGIDAGRATFIQSSARAVAGKRDVVITIRGFDAPR